MTLRSRLALAGLSVLATAALAATAADARPGQGRGQQPQASGPRLETGGETGAEIGAELEIPAPTADLPTVDSAATEVPTVEQPTAVGSENPQGLPPGLQRQVDSGRGLPPGLQRQVDSGRGLPPGLQRAR